MGQFHFDPDDYDRLMAEDVPAYGALQAAVAEAAASAPRPAARVLELGTGTGETALRVLAEHPGAALVGIDASEPMLTRARPRLPDADLRVARLQDPLPDGPFDVVFSALAVHHLDAAEKASLFARVHAVLAPGGRFVLGDLIVPEDDAEVVTPIDGVFDTPSSVNEQLGWLEEAGLSAELAWRDRDLAVLVGTRAA
ncbi:class I SAM-dependent methyltransferase [Baekduia sp. Peel2402]|uniref:class I SAM-dependent methyltransferase n=1 Tax=Baekduia sp. Peel2402 TaxID=3458296 RepID=UPI00403EE7EB